MKDGTKQSIRMLAIASTMGLAMVLATVIGLAVGYYLDKIFDTKPVLTLVFLVLGIIAGFRNLYILGKRAQDMDKKTK